ncbi:DNA repair protein RecO [Aquabacterium soli]|uniref:DNA repair protein RecO n=1 Tax=Aquabacterium soli TaxID=2493092 RepID=A0A3R8S8S2_9BURK|nr:recombination protein O N-terminal domain-containing protein [Aquabacterium soli]RRS04162.1 DNA repair protein RecO [Aquabacterium soli]
MKVRAATAAFVLHSHDWSESSLILDLFTRAHGRVVAVAKGAKRPYSQLRPVLLPFQRLSVTFGAKQGQDVEVWLLRQAEWAGGPAWPGGAAMLPGFYANELLMRLLPRHDHLPRLFDAYAELLPALTLPGTLHAALRAFELMVLRQLGHLPDLSLHSASGGPVHDDVLYTLHPELGVAEAQGEDAALPGWLMRQLESVLGPAFDPDSDGLPEPLLQACSLGSSDLRTVLRGVLHYHVGPQPLRTRQLMMDLQQT